VRFGLGAAQIDVTSGDGTHTAKYLLTVTRQERSYRLQQYQYLDSAEGKGRTWGYVRVSFLLVRAAPVSSQAMHHCEQGLRAAVVVACGSASTPRL
jgi:hypothetical protein